MNIPFYTRKREIQKEYEIMSMKYAFFKKRNFCYLREKSENHPRREIHILNSFSAFLHYIVITALLLNNINSTYIQKI